MRKLEQAREIVVGGASSLLEGPKKRGGEVVELSAANSMTVPLLPSTDSYFNAGSRSIWVYSPQGLLRRLMDESDRCWGCVTGTRPCIPHECKGATSIPETSDALSYPGHSLFVESFFLCRIKNFGDDPGAGDIYVETAVDGHSRLAFAKVYSSRNAMNALDLFAARVIPWFKQYGVAIERVITPETHQYCGLAPVHPFETLLATSKIQHLKTGRFVHISSLQCEQFFHILQQEFLPAALRMRFHQSLELLQKDLDAFVENYNSQRTGLGDHPQDRPPLRAFLDSVKI